MWGRTMGREHVLRINPSLSLGEQPTSGHNRWHEAIPPILAVDPGDTVIIETRAATDGAYSPGSDASDVLNADPRRTHPLTGPVFVNGAQPGDILEVEILDVEPDPFGSYAYTSHKPGSGLLRDHFPRPFLVHWQLDGRSHASSEQIPGVRIPFGGFPGVIGVAPSKELRERSTAREARLAATLGPSSALVRLPDADHAVPSTPDIARHALRTTPPRENGGNVDIKQLTAGAVVLLPIFVPGALFSIGDVHYAQGDSEAVGTAIEMRARVTVSFGLRSGRAASLGVGGLHFERPSSEPFEPRGRIHATTGIGAREAGEHAFEDVTLAAGNAMLAMIGYLRERGFTDDQAYAICSVAVDLRISQAVNYPNVLVTAMLPLGIFDDA